MSFSIYLYRNNSENNKVDKDLTLVATYEGELRAETSIIDPTILIECDMSDVALANYMYIPDFERYYYITNITSVRTSLVQFEAHCDVLMSFKDYILDNVAIIKRQQSDWNLYLDDNKMAFQDPPIFTVKKFPQGFSGFTYILYVTGGGRSDVSSIWVVEAVENSIQTQYSTQAGGTGILIRVPKVGGLTENYYIGSKYFRPEWTEDGVYDSVNGKLAGAATEVGTDLPAPPNILAWRTNVGYDGYNQEALRIAINDDPDEPNSMTSYNLISNTSQATALTLNAPHQFHYVVFQWAEAGA